MNNTIRRNTLRCIVLLLACGMFTQCRIHSYSKPKIRKIEGYHSQKSYNYYRFFGNEFEAQPGKNPNSNVHMRFNSADSSFYISLEDFDSDEPKTYSYQGKYNVNEHGFLQLLAESPFEKNKLQIIMWHGRESQSVRFIFNNQFQNVFPRKRQCAFCEAEEYPLEDCVIQ